MSLIQEALKRQQEDTGDGKAPKESGDATTAQPESQPKALKLKAPKLGGDESREVPAEGAVAGPPPIDDAEPPPLPDDFAGEAGVPPPLPPDDMAAGATKKQKKTVMIVVGVVCVVVLTLGAIIWLASSALKNMIGSVGAVAAPDSSVSASTDTEGPGSSAASTTSPSTPPDAPKPVDPEDPAVVPVKPELNLVATPSTGSVQTPAEPALEVKRPKEPVIWPVLSVKGVLMKRPRGIAIINGELVSAGESLNDVKVVTVGPDYVVLEFKGERKTVRPGEITD